MMDRDVKSLLSIKVLRLVRPSLIGPLPLTCDEGRDLVGDLWEKELATDVTAAPLGSGVELLTLGEFLRLPQGFGNLYLGETFTCYVVIQNESPIPVTNITVKIDLQTQSQKFSMGDEGRGVLNTGKTIDLVMNHEVKELGKHMLICTLTYSTPSQEPVFLERFFKFQVKKPLDVKTKLYNAEGDEVFLEAQVQNITAAPICLDKVDLEPSPPFNCIPMNDTDELSLRTRFIMGVNNTQFSNNSSSVPPPNGSEWEARLLDTECSRQFLYRLTPKMESARMMTSIGKLDIAWKTGMGSTGRLQTSQLQRQIVHPPELKLVVEKVPTPTLVDQPFDAKCKLINNTADRELDLRLELEDTSANPAVEGYCWMGLTKTMLGPLQPSAQLEITISIFPLRTGLINISGIKLVDMKKGEKFAFNDLVQVLIMRS